MCRALGSSRVHSALDRHIQRPAPGVRRMCGHWAARPLQLLSRILSQNPVCGLVFARFLAVLATYLATLPWFTPRCVVVLELRFENGAKYRAKQRPSSSPIHTPPWPTRGDRRSSPVGGGTRRRRCGRRRSQQSGRTTRRTHPSTAARVWKQVHRYAHPRRMRYALANVVAAQPAAPLRRRLRSPPPGR